MDTLQRFYDWVHQTPSLFQLTPPFVELQRLVKEGNRCVMFYLIQRMDAKTFEPADSIDPDYGKELRKAVKNGVEIVCYDVDINMKRIKLNKAVPVNL